MNYLGSLWQNYYMNRKEKDMKRREKKDGIKIRVDGKIPWNKKT